MDQISGTPPTDPPTQAQDQSQPARPVGAPPVGDVPASVGSEPASESPGFRSRGRARRRARFLRKARELAYRDLGGLVFNLHRFGQRNDALVLAKLTTIGHIDAELRALEGALDERRPVTVLREAGITACPRCAAIHSSEDGFCPNCGMPLSRRVDLPADFQSPAGPAAAPAPQAVVAGVPGPQPVVAGAPTTGPQQVVAAPKAGFSPVTSPAGPAAPTPPPAQVTATHAAVTTPSAGASDGQPAEAPGAATAQPPDSATPAPAGRSPTPPPSTSGAASASPAGAPADPPEEDRPTEILHPPVTGS